MKITRIVKELAEFVDQDELTEWENNFMKSILRQTDEGDDTTKLTEKQLNILEILQRKYL